LHHFIATHPRHRQIQQNQINLIYVPLKEL